MKFITQSSDKRLGSCHLCLEFFPLRELHQLLMMQMSRWLRGRFQSPNRIRSGRQGWGGDVERLKNTLHNIDCHVLLFATLWTVASQAPLSMAFSRQEY